MRRLSTFLVAGLLLAGALTAGQSIGSAPRAPDLSRNGRSPQVNYMTECQGCHLPDGRGMAGRVPPMKGEVHRFLDVEGGRAFLVQVPGSANSKLSDADLANLLNWIVTTMGPADPAVFKPYTAEEVAAYRARRLVDVVGTRRELVQRFPSAP